MVSTDSTRNTFNSDAVHAFTVALLENFYEDGHPLVTDADVEKLRGVDGFIDNDEFVFAYNDTIWTADNELKFGSIHNAGDGYFLSDSEDENDEV